MTTVEVECTKINLNMLKAAASLGSNKNEEVENLLTEIHAFLSGKADLLNSLTFLADTTIALRPETPSAPTWRYFHEIFSLMDTTRAVDQLVGRKMPKLSKEHASRLASESHRVNQCVVKCSGLLRANLSEPGMLGTLLDIVFSGTNSGGEDNPLLREVLEKMLDASALELFCGELMESWHENLSGCLKTVA